MAFLHRQMEWCSAHPVFFASVCLVHQQQPRQISPILRRNQRRVDTLHAAGQNGVVRSGFGHGDHCEVKGGEPMLVLKVDVSVLAQQVPQHIVMQRAARGCRHRHQRRPPGRAGGVDVHPELQEGVALANHAVLSCDQQREIPDCPRVPILHHIMHDHVVHRLGNLDQCVQRCPRRGVGEQTSLVSGLLGGGHNKVFATSLLQDEAKHVQRYLPPRVGDAEHQHHQPLPDVHRVLGHLPVGVVQPVSHSQRSEVVLKTQVRKAKHSHTSPRDERADDREDPRLTGLHEPPPDIRSSTKVRQRLPCLRLAELLHLVRMSGKSDTLEKLLVPSNSVGDLRLQLLVDFRAEGAPRNSLPDLRLRNRRPMASALELIFDLHQARLQLVQNCVQRPSQHGGDLLLRQVHGAPVSHLVRILMAQDRENQRISGQLPEMVHTVFNLLSAVHLIPNHVPYQLLLHLPVQRHQSKLQKSFKELSGSIPFGARGCHNSMISLSQVDNVVLDLTTQSTAFVNTIKNKQQSTGLHRLHQRRRTLLHLGLEE
mmetsp:Transcript_52502/g.139328  ORF Transcript_52502/g.139328 Transcript_52502/m.139328 type:complete len:539 (+) Transcript_52502:1259-2875(+)